MRVSTKDKLEKVLYALVFLGVFAIGQPFSLVLWHYSFPFLLIVVISFLVFNHIPTKESKAQEDQIN